MTPNQVYSIVNSVAGQMYGDTATVATSTQTLVSLGDQVLSSASDKDNFLNTLVDRIGKTVISSRAYSANVLSLMNDAFSFGAILQKIYVAPVEASANAAWGLNEGESVDQYVIKKPDVKQKLFNKRSTWSVDITIPDFQLASAFQSAEAMAAFIDAIFVAVRNSLEVYLEAAAEMCYANMIAEEIVNTKINDGVTAIDLLAAYNTVSGNTLTYDTAMINTEFLKFASRTINLYVKKLGKMNKLYNAEGYARFTPADKLRVTMLADFTTAVTSYLQANTYHDEMVALPNYNEVLYWQGAKEPGKINLVSASGYTVVQDHIVAMLSDVEALGLTYDNRRSKSAYNARGEYTNFFEKADVGYFNDISEQCVIFTVGTLTTPTEAIVEPSETSFQ